MSVFHVDTVVEIEVLVLEREDTLALREFNVLLFRFFFILQSYIVKPEDTKYQKCLVEYHFPSFFLLLFFFPPSPLSSLLPAPAAAATPLPCRTTGQPENL